MLPWIFFIVMNLPSFGGPGKDVPVMVRIQMVDAETCRRFRKMLIEQIKDMKFKFEPTPCAEKRPEDGE